MGCMILLVVHPAYVSMLHALPPSSCSYHHLGLAVKRCPMGKPRVALYGQTRLAHLSVYHTHMYPASASASTRTRRISKACENCRARRTKCEPPYPCRACLAAGLDDCQVRERARPNRWVSLVDKRLMSGRAEHPSRPTRSRGQHLSIA